jgi:hypothetical protein
LAAFLAALLEISLAPADNALAALRVEGLHVPAAMFRSPCLVGSLALADVVDGGLAEESARD